jgi:ADP-heptose:LPS heptosyltransferase
MKAIGFNAGQFGDVIMGTVAARAHKLAYPDSKLTLGIAKKYSDIQNLFANHEYFDNVHIWKGYNDYPTIDDKLMHVNFDKVYDAMPQHTSPYWYLNNHQTAELCLMHGLTPPSNLQVSLTRPEMIGLYSPASIALSLFGETRGGEKSVTLEQAKAIVKLVEKMGFVPLQLGLANEPQICQQRFVGPFAWSVAKMLGSVALITIDTAMAWIASGYSQPTVGLYGYSYYPMAKTAKNWQPVNPNAIYVESAKVSDIIVERIEAALKQLLKE